MTLDADASFVSSVHPLRGWGDGGGGAGAPELLRGRVHIHSSGPRHSRFLLARFAEGPVLLMNLAQNPP